MLASRDSKQIVRIAEAEAKADMIRAIGELKVEAIKELAERTGKRFVYEELRKQFNMESIIGKAIPAIEESAKPQRAFRMTGLPTSLTSAV